MGELHLPGGLVLPSAMLNVPRIKCAFEGCEATTERRVRAEDNPTPAPADAGWYEVEVPGTRRTVLFCCSRKHAQAVAAVVNVRSGLKSLRDVPVLPEF